MGQGQIIELSIYIAVAGGSGDFLGQGEAGYGKGQEDLPRPAGEVGDDLAVLWNGLKQSFKGNDHALKVTVIDAMDLEVNGAVYLEGEVPDGLDHLLASGVRLLFGADEDDPVSTLHAVFHNQGYNLGGIEAGKGDVGLHQK